MFRVVEAEPLAPVVTRLRVEAPLVARKRQAGQFVIVRLGGTGERIPLTLVDSDARAGTITLVVQVAGKTTRRLCALRAGDALDDVVGPLGRPTPIGAAGRAVCVGGGVGVAEVYPIARALKRAGSVVHAIAGARTRELVILEKELAATADTLVVTTDDGSHGRPGVVLDPLRELLEDSSRDGVGRLAVVYVVGPLPMMRAVAELTRPFRVPTWASLNPIMLDGTGMCGGCRVKVGGETLFACVDGPEFDAHQVDFDELLRRNRTYVCEEQRAGRGDSPQVEGLA